MLWIHSRVFMCARVMVARTGGQHAYTCLVPGSRYPHGDDAHSS